MNALVMKAEMSAYWRFVRQMPVVAVEALNEDVIVVTRGRKLVITEIKVSISDLRRDLDKRKHADIRKHLGLLPAEGRKESWVTHPERYIPNSFYFAVPEAIAIKASEIVHNLYPYAGMIVVNELGSKIPGHTTWVHRQAVELKRTKLNLNQIAVYVKAQSASLANAYSHLRELSENLQEIRNGISLHQQQGQPLAQTQL